MAGAYRIQPVLISLVFIGVWYQAIGLREFSPSRFMRLLQLSAEEFPPLPLNTAIHVGKDVADIVGVRCGILTVGYRLRTLLELCSTGFSILKETMLTAGIFIYRLAAGAQQRQEAEGTNGSCKSVHCRVHASSATLDRQLLCGRRCLA